jgi:hypothetical protein
MHQADVSCDFAHLTFDISKASAHRPEWLQLKSRVPLRQMTA